MSQNSKPHAEVVEDVCPPLERGASTLTLTPELLETLHLNASKMNQAAKPKFTNAGALGFLGFAVADCTFAMVLLGWGGASQLESVAGIFFFTGPMLLFLTTVFEFIRGMFLSMMICGFFTVFWFSFGLLQLPNLGLAAAYSTTGNAAEGAASTGYNAAIALYLVALGCALFTFFIFTLRTNLVLALIIGLATVAIFILSGAYFHVVTKDYTTALQLQHAGAGILFVVGLLGWYMTVVIMAWELDFPIKPPVYDLSHLWPQSKSGVDKEA